jgi:glycosyltransferase involved in cell wall biosynthesis
MAVGCAGALRSEKKERPAKLKILRVIASMNPASGGPCQGLRNSVSGLEELGVLSEVVCCDSPYEHWIKKDSFPVHALGPGKFGYAYTAKLQPWLEQNLFRFDAVIVHGLWQWPVQATIRAFAKLKANSPPATRHPPLFIMPHGMLDPWFQRDKSRRLKAIRNSIYWWLFERHAVNSADAILFTCEEELRLARTTFGGYRPKREINVGYGIAEPPVFESQMQEAFQGKCPELGNNPYLLFLGRIHPKKGVDLLIRAYTEVLKTEKIKTIPPHLVIVGPGWDTSYGRQMRQLIDTANAELAKKYHFDLTTERTETSEEKQIARMHSLNERGGLQEDFCKPVCSSPAFHPQFQHVAENIRVCYPENCKLKTENLPRIHAVNMLEGNTKWGAFYGCEAFVLPSHQENFGIAVVEALACNKPVLISNKVNIWREIAEDGAGLVEADSVDGTARLLHRFLVGEIAGGVAERFSDCFQRHFEIQQASKKLLEALK